jgi:uncharacterized protein (DUF1499 family)
LQERDNYTPFMAGRMPLPIINLSYLITLSGIVFSLFLIGCTGVRPANLGVKDGRLAPCPETPNCVSSQSTDKDHAIAPLSYSSSGSEALADLKKIIQQMKRTRIVTETDDYLYVEFTSALWRFVDDVEFSFDEASKTIHMRSASRLGKSDLGVNRKRIEMIRAAWNSRGK